LILAERSTAIQQRRVSLGRKAVLVRVAADARDTPESEVEWLRIEARSFQERHKKRPQATINMKVNFAPVGKSGKGSDVVDDTVREIWGGSHKQNSVAIDEAGHAFHVSLVGWRRTLDDVKFNLEIITGFPKRDMSCLRYDPTPVSTLRSPLSLET